jgi:hypothetical protein
MRATTEAAGTNGSSWIVTMYNSDEASFSFTAYAVCADV